MTILELGRTVPITDRTSPEQPFIRQIKVGPFTTDALILGTFPGLDESGRETISITGIQSSGGAVFTEQSTKAGMEALQQSYYWDFAAQTLWLHLPPADNPMASTYLYGQAQGFSDSRVVYVDAIKYIPLIDSAPAIRQQQDIENYDRLAFITGTITLSNVDGRLDELKDAPVYGNDVKLYHLDDQEHLSDDYTASDLTQLASLFVEDYDLSLNELRLRIQDRRKSQNVRIPDTRFNSTDYPNADDELFGMVVPVVWGSPREIPALVTNGTVTTGNVTYRAALLLTVLGTVYVGSEDDGWTDVTSSVTGTALATGEFELPAAQGRDADGNALEAKLVSPTGIAITYLSDIIVDATERFTGIEYNSANYDTTEWAAEETSIASGGYYLDEERDLFTVIREVQNGADVGFRYEIKPDGRRTIRVDDETRTLAKTIPNIVLANRDQLSIATDTSTLVAEVVVKYAKSYVSWRWLREVDDSSSAEVLETYRQRPRKSYDTLVTTETAAAARATYVRNRFDTVRGIGEFVLMGADYLSLRIYDIITVEITPDEPTNTGRPFYGTWKCKVLSVAPDAGSATNTITAVLIEEA